MPAVSPEAPGGAPPHANLVILPPADDASAALASCPCRTASYIPYLDISRLCIWDYTSHCKGV